MSEHPELPIESRTPSGAPAMDLSSAPAARPIDTKRHREVTVFTKSSGKLVLSVTVTAANGESVIAVRIDPYLRHDLGDLGTDSAPAPREPLQFDLSGRLLVAGSREGQLISEGELPIVVDRMRLLIVGRETLRTQCGLVGRHEGNSFEIGWVADPTAEGAPASPRVWQLPFETKAMLQLLDIFGSYVQWIVAYRERESSEARCRAEAEANKVRRRAESEAREAERIKLEARNRAAAEAREVDRIKLEARKRAEAEAREVERIVAEMAATAAEIEAFTIASEQLQASDAYALVERFCARGSDLGWGEVGLLALLASKGFELTTSQLNIIVARERERQGYRAYRDEIQSLQIEDLAVLIGRCIREGLLDTPNQVEWFADVVAEREGQGEPELDERIAIARHQMELERLEMELMDGRGTESDDVLRRLDNIDGLEFETVVERIFASRRWKVQRTGQSQDQGADLIIERGTERCVVQAKRSAAPVGNAAVQQVVASKRYYNASSAIVITTGLFTRAARKLAGANGVELINGDGVRRLIRERY